MKGSNKNYGTRSITQKVLGSHMVPIAAHNDRISRQKEQGVLPKEPIVDLVSIDDNETQAGDVTKYVAKSYKEAEEESVKSKGNQNRSRKSPTTRDNLSKGMSQIKRVKVRGNVAIKPIKEPGPRVQNLRKESKMTREEIIYKIELQKVLNGRVFASDILTKSGMSTLVDVVTIQY